MCIGEFFVVAAGKIDDENLKRWLKRQDSFRKKVSSASLDNHQTLCYNCIISSDTVDTH